MHSFQFILIFVSYSFKVFFLEFFLLVPSNYSLRSFLTKNSFKFQTNYSVVPLILPIPPLLTKVTFSTEKIYHHNGIAYDYYSKNDLGPLKTASQWSSWPLPKEVDQNSSLRDSEISPFVISKLPYVHRIYAITDPRLIDRHANLKKAFYQQGILPELIDWRMKWNYQTCNSNANHSYVYQRLNLKNIPLSNFLSITSHAEYFSHTLNVI